MSKGLGRSVPPDWKHVEKYPLKVAVNLPTTPVPVVIGVNWYSDFDNPVYDTKSRKWWIGKDHRNLGWIRGGHCVCIPDRTDKDLLSWWVFYNQGDEGACVGFGESRMMSLLNRKRYNAWWLWDRAKEVDIWPDTNPGDHNGTSVRAGLDILRERGHVQVIGKHDRELNINAGILANVWATRIQDLAPVLQNPAYEKIGAYPILNNWGKDYPHIVWMPIETHERLLNEDGEYGLVTDRI